MRYKACEIIRISSFLSFCNACKNKHCCKMPQITPYPIKQYMRGKAKSYTICFAQLHVTTFGHISLRIWKKMMFAFRVYIAILLLLLFTVSQVLCAAHRFNGGTPDDNMQKYTFAAYCIGKRRPHEIRHKPSSLRTKKEPTYKICTYIHPAQPYHRLSFCRTFICTK